LVDVGSGDDGTPDVAVVASTVLATLAVVKVSVPAAPVSCAMFAAGYDVHEYAEVLLSLADGALHAERYDSVPVHEPAVVHAHAAPPYVPATAPAAAHVTVVTMQAAKPALGAKPVGHAVQELAPGSEYVFPEQAALTAPMPPAQVRPAGHGVQPARDARPAAA